MSEVKITASEQIRRLVSERYVRPALRAGNERLSIKVRDVLKDIGNEGFPPGRTPMVCQVLLGKKLLNENGLDIEGVDGPPSKQSPTVVVHYRVVNSSAGASQQEKSIASVGPQENPEARAKRVVDGLSGLLKNEIAAYGGTEAFMRWVRSDEDEAA